MKRYILFIFWSACIHAVLLYVLYLVSSWAVLPAHTPKQLAVVLDIEDLPAVQNQRENTAAEQSSGQFRQGIKPEPAGNPEPVSLVRNKPFNKASIIHQTANPRKQAQAFLKPVVPLERDRFSFMPDSVLTGVNAAAQIRRDLDRQYSGSSGVPVSGIISALAQALSSQKTAPVFDFIPSKSQARALSTLYNTEKGTQIDLYQALSADMPVTAETFDKELSKLVDKGFLTRKTVSPQNILLAFGVPVEMSGKNRKNPVYEYTARVSRTQIVTYLQARLFRLKQKARAAGADSLSVRKQIRAIQDNIAILIQ